MQAGCRVLEPPSSLLANFSCTCLCDPAVVLLGLPDVNTPVLQVVIDGALAHPEVLLPPVGHALLEVAEVAQHLREGYHVGPAVTILVRSLIARLTSHALLKVADMMQHLRGRYELDLP